ncbi:uncharacterized protein LOC126413057 [Schistocerca serialis cubense]|uniref:uncharacterized protein LOC126413057 n=1 Tax=Schistocerca serialis cubense TaxID=2023355 RepID=UPI00214E8491|nr:uncharacterized protein LOC126413057 [Schistocerca serialis cubense]
MSTAQMMEENFYDIPTADTFQWQRKSLQDINSVKTDINSVKTDLQTEINDLNTRLNSVKAELKADITADLNTLLGNVQSQISSQITIMRLEIDTQVESKIEDISKRLDEKIEAAKGEINSKVIEYQKQAATLKEDYTAISDEVKGVKTATKAKIDIECGICTLVASQQQVTVNLLRSKVKTNFGVLQIAVRPWTKRQQYSQTEDMTDLESVNDDEYKDLIPGQNELYGKASESIELSKQQKNELYNLLTDYVQVFSKKPGLIKGFEYRMDVLPHSTYCRTSYSIPYARREAVKCEIKKMLRWNVIEVSHSPYSSPLLSVLKSDGSVRLVLDARLINKIIVPIRTTPEALEEHLQKFLGEDMS